MFRSARNESMRVESLKVDLRAILLGILTLAVSLAIMTVSEEAFARGRGRAGVRVQSRTCWMITPDAAVTDAVYLGPERLRLCVLSQISADPPVSVNRAGLKGQAGPRGRGWGARDRQRLGTERTLEAIDAIRLRRLVQTLQLNPEQRKNIGDSFAKGLVRKRDLLRERTRILERMRQVTLSDKPTDVQKMEPEIGDLVLNFRRVEREIAETEWVTQDQILEQLAPGQRARCILFNEGFNKKLRMSLGAFWQRK